MAGVIERRGESRTAPRHRKTGEVAQPAPRGALAPVLPNPPLDSEKYAYVKRHAWVLTVCSLLSFPPLVYSQVRMMQGSSWFWWYAPFVLLGFICFLLPLVTDRLGRSFDLEEHDRLVTAWQPPRYPTVDIFLPVCGEPVEVLRNTWIHVARLCRHYPGQVTPYVLDDSASPELKVMARSFGFAYATRPDRGWYKKSGNLLYGFEISEGEFILLLDADFAPRSDLLDETLPYMRAFPDTAIVQTPQYFHITDRQTWVERGAGAVQEMFYRSIQTARARKGGAICCGSCAVYRRTALEENGGMTLAEHSEDLRTGFDLQRLGWRLRYLPISLSTGNCPDNVVAYLNQQYRWCCGTLGLLSTRKFWRAKLPVYERLCWLSAFTYYLYTSVYTFIGPALAVLMLLLVPDLINFRNLIYLAPFLIYLGIIFPAWHRAPFRLEAWSVKVIIGWAHVFAFFDLLRGKPRGWRPSGASRHDGKQRLWIGLVGWSATVSVLWASLALWRMMTMDPYNFFLLFILGVFNVVTVGRVLIQPRAGAPT